MAKTQFVPITPSVLTWAVEQSGLDADALASRLKVDLTTFHAWVAGESQPTLSDFRRLVEILRRPSAAFFLPEPPHTALPTPEFRRPSESTRKSLTPKELRTIRETARVQAILSWIVSQLELPASDVPLIKAGEAIEASAKTIRQHLAVSTEMIKASRTPGDALRTWKAALENRNVFVAFLPLGAKSIRGFSLWNENVPVVAINTKWNPQARIFSMIHEFVHLCSRTSSACVEGHTRNLPASHDPIERWCEQVASAVLLPWDEVDSYVSSIRRLGQPRAIEDLETLYRIANHFKVSARATALRLIGKELMTWSLYDQIPAAKDSKQGGGGGGRSRLQARRDEYGEWAPGLLFHATRRQIVSRSDAAGYLRVSESEFDAWEAKHSVETTA